MHEAVDRLFRFSGLQQFRAKFVPSRAVDIYALLWPGVLTPGPTMEG